MEEDSTAGLQFRGTLYCLLSTACIKLDTAVKSVTPADWLFAGNDTGVLLLYVDLKAPAALRLSMKQSLSRTFFLLITKSSSSSSTYAVVLAGTLLVYLCVFESSTTTKCASCCLYIPPMLEGRDPRIEKADFLIGGFLNIIVNQRFLPEGAQMIPSTFRSNKLSTWSFPLPLLMS